MSKETVRDGKCNVSERKQRLGACLVTLGRHNYLESVSLVKFKSGPKKIADEFGPNILCYSGCVLCILLAFMCMQLLLSDNLLFAAE